MYVLVTCSIPKVTRNKIFGDHSCSKIAKLLLLWHYCSTFCYALPHDSPMQSRTQTHTCMNFVMELINLHIWVVVSNIFMFTLFGEDSHFDEYLSKGLKPPTTYRCAWYIWLLWIASTNPILFLQFLDLSITRIPFAVPGKDLKKHLPWKSWIRCARQRLNQTSAAIVRPLETVTADSFFLFLMFCLEISTFGSQLFCFNQGVFFWNLFLTFWFDLFKSGTFLTSFEV